MKIGIITFQLAWNCGAVLQCYALQEYLKSLGHEVAVINYRPLYKKYRYTKYGNPFVNASKEFRTNGAKRAAKRFVRTILDYRQGSEHLRQWTGFTSFCGQYLNLTREYLSVDELRADPPVCDLYISGSDQLWNPKLTNGQLDRAYFLDFGDYSTRRITYAISACELNLDRYGSELQSLCNGIDALSLREPDGKDKLEQLLGKSIGICPDPTFLVNPSMFRNVIMDRKKNDQEYIIVYALADNASGEDGLISQVWKLREYYHKEVLVISGPHRWPFAVKQIRGICPEEFLDYIAHAFCVVNNSFHATVFSILFQKQFVTMGFQNRNTRMQALLKNLGLQNRFCDAKQDVVTVMEQKIEYKLLEDKIKHLQSEGTAFLGNQIRMTMNNLNRGNNIG